MSPARSRSTTTSTPRSPMCGRWPPSADWRVYVPRRGVRPRAAYGDRRRRRRQGRRRFPTRRPGSADGCTASCATGARSATTTTCRTSSTRCCSTPRWPTPRATGGPRTRRTRSQDAQRDKLDLVCHKVGLEPGMRFLDIGCGWGSLSLHAAEHFGAQVTGVTIAAEQKRFIDAAHPRARARGRRGDPAAGLPGDPEVASRSPSTRSPRSRWASTSASRTTAPTRRSCTTP